MKKIIRLATLAFTLMTGAAAQASTFNFSYDFTDGTAISGSFDGTANGDLVTGLSNISLLLNGASLSSSPFRAYGFAANTGSPNLNAVVSFSGLQSNFIFTDGSPDGSTGSFFLAIPYSSTSTSLVQFVTSAGMYVTDSAPGTNVQANWHVTSVPEPETYAMLLAGLGLLGVAARRRKQS